MIHDPDQERRAGAGKFTPGDSKMAASPEHPLQSEGSPWPRLHVALYEPEIPPNTGNIARLCAATGAALHLIGRLGFQIDDKSLRRAGLDYWDAVEMHRHSSLETFEAEMGVRLQRLFCFSARARKVYCQNAFQEGDILLFGPETRGLPEEVLARYADRNLVVPIPTGKVRSLNLSTAAGIVVYEALRQLHGW